MRKILLIVFLSFNLYALEKDIMQHAVAGTIIYASCYFFTDYNEAECLVPVAVAAVGKEAYDYYSDDDGTAELKDVVATMAIPLISFSVMKWWF